MFLFFFDWIDGEPSIAPVSMALGTLSSSPSNQVVLDLRSKTLLESAELGTWRVEKDTGNTLDCSHCVLETRLICSSWSL